MLRCIRAYIGKRLCPTIQKSTHQPEEASMDHHHHQLEEVVGHQQRYQMHENSPAGRSARPGKKLDSSSSHFLRQAAPLLLVQLAVAR